MGRQKDVKPKITPGSQEEIIMRIVLDEPCGVFGLSIKNRYTDVTSQDLALTTIYTVVGRLEKKGFLRYELTPPLAERGGRRKQRFFITPQGTDALREIESAQDKLRLSYPLPVDEIQEDGA